jgi:hypothetical protein
VSGADLPRLSLLISHSLRSLLCLRTSPAYRFTSSGAARIRGGEVEGGGIRRSDLWEAFSVLAWGDRGHAVEPVAFFPSNR